MGFIDGRRQGDTPMSDLLQHAVSNLVLVPVHVVKFGVLIGLGILFVYSKMVS
jgi:hypothetical protein